MDPLATRVQAVSKPRARAKQDFGKSRRLLTASDFNRVFKQGRRQNLPELTLAFRVRPAKDGRVVSPRMGLSVSRKVGGSVQRNLLKRRLREIFRLNHGKMADGTELVVIPRKDAGKLSYSELENKIFSMLERSKMTKREIK